VALGAVLGIRQIQNKFTVGELDPRFLAQVDYPNYAKGARKLRNVVVIPQGGCARRFGTTHLDTVVDRTGSNAPLMNEDRVVLIGYDFDVTERYLIVIRPDTTATFAVDIYLDGTLRTSVGMPANTYTAAMIRQIRWVPASDRIILLHNDVRPHQLVRASANSWSISPITFQFMPTYDYSIIDNTPYTGPSFTFTPSGTTGNVTLTASGAIYTANHVGGLFYGNAGTMRITAVSSTTSCSGYTLEDFASGGAIRGDQSLLLEPVWGNGGGSPAGPARGWPAHGDFYQGRLQLGNFKKLPARGSASVVNDYYNFDDADLEASSGYSYDAGVGGNDVIQDVIGTKALVLLGYLGPSATSLLLEQATTPANVFVNSQTTNGATGVDGQLINNQILYVGQNTRSVYSMTYQIPDSGFTVSTASALSAHLIRNPRQATVYNPTTSDAEYYLLVNEDGTLATYQVMLEEEIRAWTLCDTVGRFVDAASAGNQTWVLVKRQVNTGATVAGEVGAALLADNEFYVTKNITDAINSASTDVPLLTQLGDYLIVGNQIPFDRLAFTLNTPASTNMMLTAEYLNSNGKWIPFSLDSDTTLGLTQNGTMVFQVANLQDWAAQTVNDVTAYYWIRLKRNAATGTGPIEDTLKLNVANRLLIETLDFEIYMDAQVNTTSDGQGVVSVPTLAGQWVYVYANDFPLGTFWVNASGSVNVGVASAAVAVGLDYKPLITPMPVVTLLQTGFNAYDPIHIKDAYVDYYESLGITIDGNPIALQDMQPFLTTRAPTPQTGFFDYSPYGGWDPRSELQISQSYPAPMTLLGIGYRLEVS
jgi:hypothetical protein